ERRLGGAEFGFECVTLIPSGQPEIEAEAGALPPAYQLDTGQHEAAGAKPLPAGQIRVERQTAVVARAVFTGRAGKVADPLDILRPRQLVDGAKRHVLGALLPSGVPIDAGVERLGRQPAGKDVDVSG